jgi:3D-(3,5/4)-trihydroxycyclohexane-1,2-dione acylhydrolase (decyclizing)
MGAYARKVESLNALPEAIAWAKGNDRTTVLSIVTDAFAWTAGDAWWDVGVPETSERESVRAARALHAQGRLRQRIGV